MNCTEINGCVYSFLDNTLEDSKLAEFKEHLQKCTSCAERVIAEKELGDILKRRILIECQTPDWLKGRILQSLIHLRLLRVTRADGKEETHPITENITTFGRNAKNNVVLPGDNKVSRKHCQIEFKDGKYEITDLKSKNGIYVNEKKVEHHTLSSSDKIKIGDAIILFEIPSGARSLNAEETKILIKTLPEIPHAKRMHRRRSFRASASSASESYLIAAAIILGLIIAILVIRGKLMDESLPKKAPKTTLTREETPETSGDLEALYAEINSLAREYRYKNGLIKANDFLSKHNSSLSDSQKYYLLAKIDFLDQSALKESQATRIFTEMEKEASEASETSDIKTLKKKYEDFYPLVLNTSAASKLQKKIIEITALVETQINLERNLEGLKSELAPEIAKGNYSGAIKRYKLFKESTENITLQKTAAGEIDSVNRFAKSDFESVIQESHRLIEIKDYEKTRALFTGNQARFRETSYSPQIDSELFLINKLISQEADKKKMVRQSCLKLFTQAEESASRYDYADAIAKLKKALNDSESYSPEFSGQFSEKLKETEKENALFGSMANKIKGRSVSIPRISLKGSVISANNESFFASGRNTDWSLLTPEEVFGLFKLTGLIGSETDPVAMFCLKHKFMDGIFESFNTILKKSPKRKPELEILLSKYTGKPVPPEGFVIYKDRWLTPEEKSAITSKENAIQTAAKLKSAIKLADIEKNCREFSRLAERNAPYLEGFRNIIIKSLKDKYNELNKALDQKLGSVNLDQLKILKKELNKRRAEALKEIREGATEPGPGNKPKLSAAMEKKISEVRTLWNKPLEKVVQLDSIFKDIVDRMTVLAKELKKYERQYEEVTDLDILSAISTETKIDLKNIPLNGTEARLISDNKKVMEENDKNTAASAEEKESIRLQNEYRIMMGLKVTRIDDKLVRASRKHSAHMQGSGRFAHGGIGDGDPGNRARNEGFTGPVGENIFMTGAGSNPQSNPQTSFTAWYWSHGHHLNMVNDWDVVGVGVAGGYYTTMFGR